MKKSAEIIYICTFCKKTTLNTIKIFLSACGKSGAPRACICNECVEAAVLGLAYEGYTFQELHDVKLNIARKG